MGFYLNKMNGNNLISSFKILIVELAADSSCSIDTKRSLSTGPQVHKDEYLENQIEALITFKWK